MRAHLGEFTLLYAEDEAEVQKNLLEYFSSYFKEVYIASDGQEAYDLYRRKKPDVTILDINMPHLSGLEIAQKIRENDSFTRIIMLTAHSEVDLLLKAAEINMSRYLLKPVSNKDLKEVLNKVAKELLSKSKKIFNLGEETIFHMETMQLSKEGKEIELTEKERKLLSLLIERKGVSVTFEDIIANVWENSFEEEISRDSVKSQINYLRKKIPKDTIASIYGKGYFLKA